MRTSTVCANEICATDRDLPNSTFTFPCTVSHCNHHLSSVPVHMPCQAAHEANASAAPEHRASLANAHALHCLLAFVMSQSPQCCSTGSMGMLSAQIANTEHGCSQKGYPAGRSSMGLTGFPMMRSCDVIAFLIIPSSGHGSAHLDALTWAALCLCPQALCPQRPSRQKWECQGWSWLPAACMHRGVE